MFVLAMRCLYLHLFALYHHLLVHERRLKVRCEKEAEAARMQECLQTGWPGEPCPAMVRQLTSTLDSIETIQKLFKPVGYSDAWLQTCFLQSVALWKFCQHILGLRILVMTTI